MSTFNSHEHMVIDLFWWEKQLQDLANYTRANCITLPNFLNHVALAPLNYG